MRFFTGLVISWLICIVVALVIPCSTIVEEKKADSLQGITTIYRAPSTNALNESWHYGEFIAPSGNLVKGYYDGVNWYLAKPSKED